MIERKILILQCPECAWRAFRDNAEGLRICSKCGHKGPPIVMDSILEIKENPYYKELFKYCKEYTDRLLDGETLEDVMERMNKCKDQSTEAVDRRNLNIISGIVKGFLSANVVWEWCAKGHPSTRNEETY